MRDVLTALGALPDLLGPLARRRLGVLVLLGLAMTGLEVIGASAVYALLALLAGEGPDGDLGPLLRLLPDLDAEALRIGLPLGLIGFFAARAVAVVLRAFLEARIVNVSVAELSERLMSGFLRMPYLEHTRRNSAQMIRDAMQAPAAAVNGTLAPLAAIIAEVTLLSGLVGLLLATDPHSALAGGLTLGAAVALVQRVIRPRLSAWGRITQDAYRNAVRNINESLGGVRDVKLLAREEQFLADFSKEQRRLARSHYLRQSVTALPSSLIELALVSTLVVLLILGSRGGGGADLAGLSLFAYAGLRLQPAVQRLVGAVNQIRFHRAAVEDLLAQLAAAPPSDRPAGPSERSAPGGSPGRIELRGVGLRYPGADPGTWALRGVELVVEAGEFVGICGPTGGGKSTLLDVLTGLLPPDEGEVSVDGRPLEAEPQWWWSHLGVVSQQAFLIDATLRRNIALGVDERSIDADRLAACLSVAQLERMVEDLPLGLDTPIGERGVRLSGGQRQRVALARALYREPPVVVLDEGTSALDTETETAVMAALERLGPGRTVIAVAHRLSTIRRADRIVVVEAGRIAGSGPWDELVRTSPTFGRLVEAASGPGGGA